jgi:3-hydroxyisobutyrate dehydrogenase-like beta-hydroxyacid dehydrogenase
MSKKVQTLERDGKTRTRDMGRLGFIGLGYMGSRIAKRLIDAGHRLVLYNRDRAKTEALVSEGVEIADNPGELASAVEIILSCLSDGSAVRDIYLSDEGVLDHTQPGSVIVEMSTIAPETSIQLAAVARELGIAVLDVAISGSTPAAESGMLTLFGGGDQESFEAVTPLFPALAKQWFYLGESGSGVAMKLVVNTLLGVGMEALAEGLALGGRLGLDRRRLFDTLTKTAVVPPALLGKLASAKEADYRPEFPARLMNKDFRLITSKAANLGVAMPATVEAARIMAAEILTHPREEDFSAVVRALEQMVNKGADR